ncbi:MAG: AAA family ATPase, partial [Proteobacteria bacterium]|nr:AAA family ATPase [Pseudomonadota bacterium]
MNALPVKRACDLTDSAEQPGWLIEDLWADQAVGILGGEPKCCKSFLALDIAVSVASGAPLSAALPGLTHRPGAALSRRGLPDRGTPTVGVHLRL